jgi:hypothetical protein
LPNICLHAVPFLVIGAAIREGCQAASPISYGVTDKGRSNVKHTSLICALALSSLAAAATTAAAQSGVQAGSLECHGAPTTSFIVGSVHQLDCVFASVDGPRYHYVGIVRHIGVDIGFTAHSSLGWAVFAPTHWIGPGDLTGVYAGVTAGAAIGIGGNANALIGGSGNSFALQPLSFEGQTGINVAVGVAGLELQYAGGGYPHYRHRLARYHRRHYRH